MNRPRVLVADDHQILAEGVRGLLEPEFEVVALVADGRELVVAARTHRPDVIVADVSMPLLNGLEAFARLRAAGIRTKVVFLTMHRDVAYARMALDRGAAGYVLKHSVASELIAAVRAALRGQTYVSPLIAGELLESYRSDGGALDPASKLTPRQREVLHLFAEGRTAKEVAADLHISKRTAEAHKARILEALDLHSIAGLVQFAVRNGIISV